MQKFINVLSLLGSIDKDSSKAIIIVSCVFGGVLLLCAMMLIFKKILLNRKYHKDEQFVKEYRQKLEEKERKEKEKQNSGLM